MGAEKSAFVIDVETGEVLGLRDLQEKRHCIFSGNSVENIRMPKIDILYNKLIKNELTSKTEDEFYYEIEKENIEISIQPYEQRIYILNQETNSRLEYFYIKP